jgi:DNA polymerase beta
MKETIIQALDILRKRDLADKQPFRARAYQTVITQLKQRTEPVTVWEDVAGMKGMGEKIEKKVKEILATGHLRSAERAKELYPIDALDAFQNIYGVGPAKAMELANQGLRSISELREKIQQNPKLLNDKQKIGLIYYEPLLERIPRAEMEEHRDVLFHYLPSLFTGEIVGSFRRGAITSGDIDVLIRVPKGMSSSDVKTHLAAYVTHLTTAGYIKEVLAIGEHKCMAICQRDETSKSRRLDLLMTPEEEYAYSILYFTGSDRFNVAFRQHALSMGYTLNEHALTVVKAPSKTAAPMNEHALTVVKAPSKTAAPMNVKPVPPMATEEDIFRFMGLRYIPPTERVDSKQIIKRSKPRVAPMSTPCPKK